MTHDEARLLSDPSSWDLRATPPPLPALEAIAGELVVAYLARLDADAALERARVAVAGAEVAEAALRARVRVGMANAGVSRVEMPRAVVVAVRARTRLRTDGVLEVIAHESVRIHLRGAGDQLVLPA